MARSFIDILPNSDSLLNYFLRASSKISEILWIFRDSCLQNNFPSDLSFFDYHGYLVFPSNRCANNPREINETGRSGWIRRIGRPEIS